MACNKNVGDAVAAGAAGAVEFHQKEHSEAAGPRRASLRSWQAVGGAAKQAWLRAAAPKMKNTTKREMRVNRELDRECRSSPLAIYSCALLLGGGARADLLCYVMLPIQLSLRVECSIT